MPSEKIVATLTVLDLNTYTFTLDEFRWLADQITRRDEMHTLLQRDVTELEARAEADVSAP